MNHPAEFSNRQKQFMFRAMASWFNVAEGGKRGGKNVLTTMIFCMLLETHPDKIHLVAGVSGATAKLNILDCDGYGLTNFFEGRCREGKYKDRDCVYISTKTGEKVVLVSGGGKKGDEKLIKGNTYGMAYITEANECHPDFIREVFDRTLSSKDRKIFHDLNPKEPEHWYYTDVLNFHEEQQSIDKSYGYNYGHFTIADNLALSDDRIRQVLKTYRKGTVWYDRDIKGARVVAEGIIFRYLAENPNDYIVPWEDYQNVRFSKLVMGIDFGGNGSITTFFLQGYMNGYKDFIGLEEEELPKKDDIDTKAICDKFIEFYKMCIDRYGRVDWIFPDSASPTLINSLIASARENGLPYQHIAGVTKNEVAERPRMIDELLQTGRQKFTTHCPKTVKAIASLRWDTEHPEKNIPEDKNIGNINDRYDAYCYSFITFIPYIGLRR